MYDLFGITFEGHPDLTRILMPDEWVGSPLRKDDAAGAGHVQRRPEPAMTTETDHDGSSVGGDRSSSGERSERSSAQGARGRSEAEAMEARRLIHQTDEGAQELRPMRDLVLTGSPWPEDEVGDTMVINMGPQHPSTHGVLRIMMELDAESVLQAKAVIGYLHTGMEKTGEELTYVQGVHERHAHGLRVTAVERARLLHGRRALLDIEVPERAQWMRMMLVELNRISSHLLFQATNGMDLGAVSMMLYGWRDREEVLRLLEMITGLRMNHNFIRVGGLAADLPDGWQEATLTTLEGVARGVGEYDDLLSSNPVWRERTVGVGVITTEECLAHSITGPILRSTGFAWDLRKAQPYLRYDDVDFDIIYTDHGDVFDRYQIRLEEIRESIRIVQQCVKHMPKGDYRVQDLKITTAAAGPHRRVDGSADPPLQTVHRGLPRSGGRDVRVDREPAR